jgi:putative endonuclease
MSFFALWSLLWMANKRIQPARSSASEGSRKRLGNAGERLAAQHLQQAGYVVRAMNYRCQAGEIDIVAEEAGDIVFVEVKTRRGTTYGLPEEAITLAKQRKLIAAAQTYLDAEGRAQDSWRVDMVAVALTPAGTVQEVRIHRHAISAD